MKIRTESAVDCQAISEVHLAAFANQPFSQQTEHLIVEGLRAAGSLCVSLVAEMDNKVVAHVAFSPVMIDGQDWHWYALGPVGVLPPLQKRGIGSTLIRQGLECLRQLSAEGCVLVGEPVYYGRFGFRQCAELTIEGFPAEFVLCLPMTGHQPHGRVEHHPAFSVQPRSTSAD